MLGPAARAYHERASTAAPPRNSAPPRRPGGWRSQLPPRSRVPTCLCLALLTTGRNENDICVLGLLSSPPQVPLGLRLGPLTAISCGLAQLPRMAKGSAYKPSKLPKQPLVYWCALKGWVMGHAVAGTRVLCYAAASRMTPTPGLPACIAGRTPACLVLHWPAPTLALPAPLPRRGYEPSPFCKVCPATSLTAWCYALPRPPWFCVSLGASCQRPGGPSSSSFFPTAW